jgi:hypothetical protein
VARLVEVAFQFIRVKIRPRGRVVYYGHSKVVKALDLQGQMRQILRFIGG